MGARYGLAVFLIAAALAASPADAAGPGCRLASDPQKQAAAQSFIASWGGEFAKAACGLVLDQAVQKLAGSGEGRVAITLTGMVVGVVTCRISGWNDAVDAYFTPNLDSPKLCDPGLSGPKMPNVSYYLQSKTPALDPLPVARPGREIALQPWPPLVAPPAGDLAGQRFRFLPANPIPRERRLTLDDFIKRLPEGKDALSPSTVQIPARQ